jgi:hypothetical protein
MVYQIPSNQWKRLQNDAVLKHETLDIVDKIEVSSDTISEPLVFDKIRSFIK